MSRPRTSIDGQERTKRYIYATDREFDVLQTFLARMRVRSLELNILGVLRRAEVEIWLDKDTNKLMVRGADADQMQAIRDNKELIISALEAEKKAGMELWDHTALCAGIEKCYRDTLGNLDNDVAPEECIQLIGLLDKFLGELDEVGYLGLPDAIARYARVHDMMAPLIQRINSERAQQLSGRDLFNAAHGVFRGKVAKESRGRIDLSAFQE